MLRVELQLPERLYCNLELLFQTLVSMLDTQDPGALALLWLR